MAAPDVAHEVVIEPAVSFDGFVGVPRMIPFKIIVIIVVPLAPLSGDYLVGFSVLGEVND